MFNELCDTVFLINKLQCSNDIKIMNPLVMLMFVDKKSLFAFVLLPRASSDFCINFNTEFTEMIKK